MKIIHVTNNAEAEGATLGVERQAANLAVAQRANGYEVIMALDRPGIFNEVSQEHDIPITVHDALGQPWSRPAVLNPDESKVQDFMAFLMDYKPDIIHCHSWPAALIAIMAGNRVDIPCVVAGISPNIAIQATRRGLRFATMCLIEGDLDELREDIPDIEAYYVPNGTRVVPPIRIAETDHHLANDGHSVNLIQVGSLVQKKCHDVTIMAMFELRRRLGGDCPVLNIYGDGPREGYLTEITNLLGLNDNVRFRGFKPGILEQCPSTDMLIMSSWHELSPFVVVEAMSRGMPIVATDVGDVTSKIPDERYGRVIPPYSVLPLADAIESLLQDVASGQFNPDLLIERHRSLYSFEKWVENTQAVYNQVLQASNG